MTRWFLDTEFNEDGRTIELISIALVSEDGREYYAVSSEFDPDACNDWVKTNVLPLLVGHPVTSRADIARQVRDLLLTGNESEPEIWGYFSDYDWVVFCQLFGRMVDLPKGLPFWCRDLKQRMTDCGAERTSMPPQAGADHSALEDARWIRDASLWLDEQARAAYDGS